MHADVVVLASSLVAGARRIALAIAVATCVVAPVRVGAQHSSDARHFAAGVLGGRDVRQDSAFRVGSAFAQWAPGGGAFALRIDATYGERPDARSMIVPPRIPCFPSAPCPGPIETRTTTRTIGATLGPSLELVRHGPVRPYLIGGAGAFRTTVRSTRTASFSCSIETLCTGPTAVTSHESHARWRATLHAGAGVGVRAGPVWIVGEARYLLADDAPANGVRGIVPLMIGLRY